MKKKYLYSLLIPYLLSTGTLMSCDNSNSSETNLPKHSKSAYVYKTDDIKVRTDTLNVTNQNYKQISTKGAAGVFFTVTNTVVVYQFNAMSDNPQIVNFCNYNNALHTLTVRHELEHARKRDLTHKTTGFSPVGRAEIAAMNEIIAPASEIIEAVDYHARTGVPMPQTKSFIANADSVIFQTPGVLPGHVNYNYQPVADAVITYATQDFLNSVKRGYYKYTICKAYNKKTPLSLQQVDFVNYFTFNPDQNKWNPIWEFESDAGECNPYKYASQSVRQRMLQKVDSIVHCVTGADKIALFLKNSFSY